MTLLVLLGCTQQPSHAPKPSKDNAPTFSDTYIEASIGDASFLNPLLATDSASGDINALVYNGLVKYDKDIRIVGDLAESFEVSKDGLVITFHLRPQVRWHDGQPFTAEDVLFTFQKLRDPKVRTPFSSDFEKIRSLRTPDAHTVIVTYSEPFAPGLASWGIGIIAKHVYQKGDFNSHPANRRPTGTGPFKFKEWKTDEKIVLVANPDYFEGRPYLDRYLYRILPDAAVQFLELRNESIDSMNLTPDQYKAYEAIFERYNRFRYPSFQYAYMGFNLRHPFFKDKRVRKAIAHAIDKQTLVNGILLGFGRPVTGPFPPASWAYNHQVQDVPCDPEKARAILRQAGWSPGPEGILQKNGQPFSFTLITNQGNKVRALAAEIIQQQLKAIGIQVDVRILEWATFLHQYIDKKTFDACILGWQLGRDPDQYSIWHSSQNQEGQYNFISYSHPEVDRLLVEGRRVFDPTQRQAIYQKIHALLAEDLPYLFLYNADALPAIHKRFRGPEVAPLGMGWNFREWWAPAAEQKYRTQAATTP